MNHKRVIILILLAAAVVRVLVVLQFENRLYFPDSEHFTSIAQNILDGHGPRLSERTVANRGPGYSYFLAGIFAVTGGTSAEPPLLAIRLVQALLGAVLCYVIYLLGSRLFSKPAGLAAAALVAFDPFLTYFTGLVLTETLFTLLMALMMLTLLKSQEGGIRWGIAAGFMCGLALLVRPAMLLMLPLLLAAYLLAGRFSRRSFATACIFAACSVAMLIPWAARNYRLTGSAALTTLSAGASLYEGTYPGADGGPALDKLEDEIRELTKEMGEVERNDFMRKRAYEVMRAEPGRMARLAVVKLHRFWSIFPNFSDYRSIKHMAVSASYMVPMLALIVAGLVLRRDRLSVGIMLLVPAVYFSALHAVFVGSVRYRAPVMPLLAVFAGAAAVEIYNKIAKRNRNPAQPQPQEEIPTRRRED